MSISITLFKKKKTKKTVVKVLHKAIIRKIQEGNSSHQSEWPSAKHL